MAYLDESVPADTEAVNLGAGRIRALKVDLDALIEQIFEDTATFLPGWITAGGATGGTSMFALGAIQSADIGAGQVGTSNLADTAVTLAKLAAQSVDVTKLVSGIVMPTASVSTNSMQPGALSATTQGRAIVGAGFITPAMMGFAIIQSAIGNYAGSNSASAEVNTLAFEPDVVILTGSLNFGIGVAFRSEAVSGTSPIHISWSNTAFASPWINGVQWIAPTGGGSNGGFIVVPSGVVLNESGANHTYVALDI
jgi:hypothetical protein